MKNEMLFRKEGDKYVPVMDGEKMVSIEKVKKALVETLKVIIEKELIWISPSLIRKYFPLFSKFLSE